MISINFLCYGSFKNSCYSIYQLAIPFVFLPIFTEDRYQRDDKIFISDLIAMENTIWQVSWSLDLILGGYLELSLIVINNYINWFPC